NSYTLSDYIENLTLTDKAIYGTGNARANALTGNAEDNVLNGAGGADTMVGGAGNDDYQVDNIQDKVVENNVTDHHDRVLSTVTYTLPQYVEDLALMGASKIDGTGNDIENHITG